MIGDDFESGEERPVQDASDLGAGFGVGLAGALREAEDLLEGSGDIAPAEVACGKCAVCCGDLLEDLVLACSELVLVDGAGEIGVKEAFFGVLGPRLRGAVSAHLAAEVGVLGRDLRFDVGADVVGELLWHCDGSAPEGDDLVLDLIDWQVWEAAAAAAAVGAEVVVVLAAAPAGGAGEHQPFAALAAEQRAAQVVAEGPLFEASSGPVIEDRLDPQVGIGIDQWWVASVVLDVLEADLAEVVPVAQHTGDHRLVHRPARPLPAGHGPQASILEGVGEVLEAQVPERERLERPRDQGCALGVDGDGGDVVAVDAFTDVEVADRCPAWRAAELSLLHHALRRFGGEVRGVVLVDAGEHAMHQLASGGVIDGLAARHKLGAVLADAHGQVDVVGSIASEPVELVDDNDVDVTEFLDALQHHLDRGAIGDPSRLSPIDVLVDDIGAQLLGLAVAGLALGRDAVALSVLAAAGLLVG